ncbi:MAG: hypothetical protein WDN49_02440 [Acetobacteraceae bacterium]
MQIDPASVLDRKEPGDVAGNRGRALATDPQIGAAAQGGGGPAGIDRDPLLPPGAQRPEVRGGESLAAMAAAPASATR